MTFITLEDGRLINLEMIVLIGKPESARGGRELCLLNYPQNYRLSITDTDYANIMTVLEKTKGVL